MRRTFLSILLAVSALVTLPCLSVAQAAPLDSAIGNGSTGGIAFQFNVTSGPSGENPSGTSVLMAVGDTFTSTKVVCLSVSGNTGAYVVQVAPNPFGFTFVKALAVDNGPTGDTFGAEGFGGSVPPDCSLNLQGGTGFLPSPLTSGDITVFDAPLLPTSKDQCKKGGWMNYPQFKNQGDCVSFVENGK
jgi:hypothetical protein